MLRSHRLERLTSTAKAANFQPEDRGFVMKTTTFTGKGSLSLLLCAAGLLGFVAPQARADEEKDPPTRVARISLVDGSVSLQPGGQGDWGAAARNRPMTIGDKLWVDKDSRAELQAGAVSIHLGSMTALSFLNLDEGITQMRLAEGSVNFRVRELRQGDTVELDAPNLAFVVKEAGAFRIDVSEDGNSTRVTVIRGEGEVTADGKTYPIHNEERGEFTGTENIQSHFDRSPGPDGLDRWAADRDLKEDNSVSGKYVSKDMDGYGDLDDNGTWSEEPEYGHVWYPNEVDPGWAPYSNGYWNWVGPWGWTWVDYSPWGFAPYHYGRWAFIGSRWGWCPGPFYGPAIYGPAFVGFFGGGFGFGVGWFPLGFGEPFFPWYHCRGGYIRNINIHNTFIRNTNVFNRGARNFNYVNAHNVRAVTVANRNAFTSGQAINRGATHLTEASLRDAHVSNSVGLKPTQHSALGSVNMRANAARPPASVQSRGVVARTAPAQGASQSRVRTFNSAGLSPGRTGNASGNASMNQRSNTPNSSFHNSPAATGAGNAASPRGGNNSRTWDAQGNSTDRGRAPAGFGSSNRPANEPAQSARVDSNRPPWARGNAQSGSGNGQTSRPSTPNYNSGRSYGPPQRSYGSAPNYGGGSQPRTYSAPSRSYPAPSRSYSPPSRSYGGGGGGSRGSSGGGSPHGSSGGGGASHGGGGGSPHGGGGSSSHGRP